MYTGEASKFKVRKDNHRRKNGKTWSLWAAGRAI